MNTFRPAEFDGKEHSPGSIKTSPRSVHEDRSSLLKSKSLFVHLEVTEED